MIIFRGCAARAFRECATRAARTFLQAALGYAVANIAGVAEDTGFTKKALAVLLTASVAAGLAAVMNLPKRGGNDKAKEDSEGE